MSMKQLLILSGKGGTGKTTIASAFIRLSEATAYADCDVDSPNLHLISGWNIEPKRTDYCGLPRATIDPDLCIACDLCREHCRFSAISVGADYRVNTLACEGCGVCEYVCPAGAIAMKPQVDGDLMLYADSDRAFSTARLNAGSGTSGLLVTQVKRQMQEKAGRASLAIIDGSPGIGCPVIASLSGVDLVLVVAEPSISGISDLGRVIATAQTMGVETAICVNKYDTNLEKTRCIEEFCRSRGLPFSGKIPYDAVTMQAINQGISIVDIDCIAGTAVRKVYEETMQLLLGQNDGE